MHKLLNKKCESEEETNIKSKWLFKEPTQEDYVKIIKNMKDSKAEGIDRFSVNNFKNSLLNTANLLTKITKAIIDKESWPSKMKTQIIRPIFKKGKKNDISNYRPIAILPVLNKFVEKYFAEKLMEFLQNNDIITKNQFGFQKGKGTTEALKSLNEKIASALNEGKFVGAIFVDLQKAFDTINRRKIIEKLKKLGLDTKFCNILCSYLTERKCCVRIGKEVSSELEINDGVPQGSVLGPLLFLVYINDIDDIADLNPTLFADDILSLIIAETRSQLNQEIDRNLNNIHKWCTSNEVYISEEKTKVMIFRDKTVNEGNFFIHKESCRELSCRTDCTEIKKVNYIKYLGLTLDSQWNFSQHIDNLNKKLRQMLPKMYLLKKILSHKNKLIIYESWIKSHISYALEIYGSAGKKGLNQLQKLQNKIVKILFCNCRRRSIDQVYNHTKILKVKQLYEYMHIVKHFFEWKAIYNEKVKSKPYQTKSTKFIPLLTKNKYGEKLADFVLPNIFSKLPTEIWLCNTYKDLKLKVKNWLSTDACKA